MTSLSPPPPLIGKQERPFFKMVLLLVSGLVELGSVTIYKSEISSYSLQFIFE